MVKTCVKCQESRPADDFWTSRAARDGLHSYCKPCARSHNRDWYRSNPAKARSSRITNKYGLSAEDYAALAQLCGACGDAGALVVDHDHATGAVRELLCQACNKALGFVRDDVQRLRALIDYLERHRG